jgi:hypothetical protein
MTHTDMINSLLKTGADMRSAQKQFEAAKDHREKQSALKVKRSKETEFENVLHNVRQLVRLPVP